MSVAAAWAPGGRSLIPLRAASAHPQRNWIQLFIIFQVVCQLFLLTPISSGPFRSLVRIAAFGMSLVFLATLPGKGSQPYPAAKAALAVFGILLISLFNPETNSVMSGLAQIGLYLAIMGPIFWVPRLTLDQRAFRMVLLTIWGFYTLSAVFGILQVYFPGKFQPNVSIMVTARGTQYLRDLTMLVGDGQRVFRPMGLTDTPGGGGTAGYYAVLLGLGFLLTDRSMLRRFFFSASMLVGMTCLYLCQVRSLVVMLGFCLAVFAIMLAWRGAKLKLTILLSVMGAVITTAFLWAVSMGGADVNKRLFLLSNNPGKAYYNSRGVFLEYTINHLLPKYPLGAGLGRWGMMNAYFGDHTKPSIWVEIQWTAWLLDGGIPLILAYIITLGFAVYTVVGIFRRKDLGDLWVWAAVLLAYDVGTLANTFSYSCFLSQYGMEFWILNASLFAVARDGMPMRWVRRMMPAAVPMTAARFGPDFAHLSAHAQPARPLSGR